MADGFSFDIFGGVSDEDSTCDTLGQEENQEQDATESQPKPKRAFIPRTPDSAKIGRGERGALISKMVAALTKQIELENPDYTPERTVTEDSPDTDLQDIDPEIREILNSFGIFFFNQISSSIFTTYGTLLTRRGKEEDYQRMAENNLLFDENDEYVQDVLKSQEVIHK